MENFDRLSDMPADERLLLGMTAGLCSQEPREQLSLEALVCLLTKAQRVRGMPPSAEGRP